MSVNPASVTNPPAQFPENFVFGGATAAYQVEGETRTHGKGKVAWDDFLEAQGRFSPDPASDFYNQYPVDLELCEEFGINGIRLSIAWSRIFPNGTGEINPEGVQFYHDLFAECHKHHVEPFVTLHHFDTPLPLFEKGDFLNRETIDAFVDFATFCFKEYADQVTYWFTFNEPIVEPEQRYQEGVWFPQLHDFNRARAVQYHISLAHALAVANYRKAYDEGAIRADAKIGMINCFTPVYTKQNPSEADIEAVRMTSGINNRWWLDLITKGELPADVLDSLAEGGVKLPFRAGDQEILKQGVVDWLGCNYYHPTRVQAPASKVDQYGLPHFADEYVWPDAVMNESRGWEIYPQGLYDFGMDCAKNYPDLEWFVSENGIGIMDEYKNRDAEGTIQDDYRVDFVRQHLEWVAKAIAEGAKCRGYHYWAVIDNWSWANAFKNRYGFVEVDLMDGYKRRLKKSAAWLKQVATTHVVD